MKEGHIVVRIEQDKLKKLQKIAKEQDLSVSWLIRKAVDKLLEASDAHKPKV
jgi:predicted transcriptional regulator